jgi:DNA-binding NarL/FixJ family response regulator
MQVVGEAWAAVDALALCNQVSPDVVIMGLEAGDVEATRALKHEQPDVPIVALTAREDRAHFFEMAQAGASAYVPKHAALTDLANAIRAVHTGQIVLHPSIAAMLVEGYRQRIQDSRESSGSSHLTPQELGVLELLANGSQNKEIAQRLGISARTVARYLTSLSGKLGLHSRAELVRYAIDQNLRKAA